VRPDGLDDSVGAPDGPTGPSKTGECEVVGEKLGGIAVHTGARVAAQAAPNEVLVSSTVKDLVAGSSLKFQDRGVHLLKGIPGGWRLFAVVSA
jgi:class 3 adenylate cyclase